MFSGQAMTNSMTKIVFLASMLTAVVCLATGTQDTNFDVVEEIAALESRLSALYNGEGEARLGRRHASAVSRTGEDTQTDTVDDIAALESRLSDLYNAQGQEEDRHRRRRPVVVVVVPPRRRG